jgi:hypothetical protein
MLAHHRHGSLQYVVALLALSGCASNRADESALIEVPVSASSSLSLSRLGRAEIASVDGSSLDEVVRRLRPGWLRADAGAPPRSQNASPVVYVNAVYSGELTALRTIASAATVEVFFLRPLEARLRFGRGCPCDAGVILVITRSERE